MIATVLVWLMTPTNKEAYEEFLSLGISKAWPSRDNVESIAWVRWLRSTKRRCILLGTSHSKWCSDAQFREALEDRLRNNVQIEILFLKPNGTAVVARAAEEKGGRDTIHEIQTAIRILWDIRNAITPDMQSRLKLFVYDATPSMGVTWIDERFMIVSHILAGSMNVTSPCLLLEPGRYHTERQGLYETYEKNVVSIKDDFSEEINAQNVQDFLPPIGPRGNVGAGNAQL
jgi:hypothetical protein